MNAVILYDAVAGDGPDSEAVWVVDVRQDDGSTGAAFGWGGIYDDEERAEDEALALAGRLDLPLLDERSGPFPAPGGARPCTSDGDAA